MKFRGEASVSKRPSSETRLSHEGSQDTEVGQELRVVTQRHSGDTKRFKKSQKTKYNKSKNRNNSNNNDHNNK